MSNRLLPFVTPLFIASMALAGGADTRTVTVVGQPLGGAANSRTVTVVGSPLGGASGGAPVSVTVSASSPDGARSSESSSMISVVEGDTKVEITTKVTVTVDDKGNENRNETNDTKVTVDGKEIPQDRIRRQGNVLQVLDEHGNPMRTVELPQMSQQAFAGGGGGRGGIARALAQARGHAGSALGATANSGASGGSGTSAGAQAGASNQPKVMLGVIMEQPDKALAQQLRLNAQDVTLIGTVNPDTPAAKAGLQESDIIVAIDGQTPSTQQKIRQVLQSKEPGQNVTLSVISGGQKKDVTVTLEAFDPSRLNAGATATSIPNFSFGDADDPQQLRELLMKLQADGALNIDLDDLKEILVAPSAGGVVVTPGGPGGNAGGGPGGGPGAGGGVYRFRMQQPGDDNARIRELEERLRVMTEMMQQLEERLSGVQRTPGSPVPPRAPAPPPPPPPPSGPRA
ncbi:MAG: PDZ domain-containing protein [Phycisphaerales bacterium]